MAQQDEDIQVTFAPPPERRHIFGSKTLVAVEQQDGRYVLYDETDNGDVAVFADGRSYDWVDGLYRFSGCENPVVMISTKEGQGLVDYVTGEDIIAPGKARASFVHESAGVYIEGYQLSRWEGDGVSGTLTSIPLRVRVPSDYRNELNVEFYYYKWDYEHNGPAGSPRVVFCDREGREIPERDLPFDVWSSFFDYPISISIVLNGVKYGILNECGEFVAPCEYDYIEVTNNCLWLYNSLDYETWVKSPTKYIWSFDHLVGIADRELGVVVPCEYASVNRLYYDPDSELYEAETRYRVKKSITDTISLYGLLDRRGNEILPTQYASIETSLFGRSIVRKQSETGVGMTDFNGKPIIPAIYDEIISSYNPEYVYVVRNGKKGLVTPDGKVLIPPDRFEDMNLSREHDKLFYFVQMGGKWGRADATGKILLAPIYESIEPYREQDDDSMVVQIKGQWMRVDSRNRVVERYEKNPYEVIIEFDNIIE